MRYELKGRGPEIAKEMVWRNKMKVKRASDKLWKRAFDTTAAARVAKAKWEQAQLVASEAWAKAVAGTPPQYVYPAPKKSAVERR